MHRRVSRRRGRKWRKMIRKSKGRRGKKDNTGDEEGL
jgi:hypothetical protein